MIEKGLKVILILSDFSLALALFLGFFQARWGFSFHLASAGVAILLSFFANSCAIFYFVGSGVWLKDEAKNLAPKNREGALKIWGLYEKANKLKGRAFPLPSLNIALALFTFILGGAAQVHAVSPYLHVGLGILFVITSFLSTRVVFSSLKTNLTFLDEATQIIDQSHAPPLAN